jgi:DnaJ-class molecular chaperone
VYSNSLTLFSSGFVQTIKGKGMPEFEKTAFGDLYVEYSVVLPTALPADTRRSECVDGVSVISANYILEIAEAFHGKDHAKDEL